MHRLRVRHADVPKYLADADVGIVPYEESVGTHCAFAAKPVEYSAVGVPVVCTPLKSVMSYFKDVPLIRFSKFDGADFGRTVLSWLDESPKQIAAYGKSASEKVRELIWTGVQSAAKRLTGWSRSLVRSPAFKVSVGTNSLNRRGYCPKSPLKPPHNMF